MACIIEDNNPSEIIFGCTDPLAINYFSGATVDDGSCTYPETIIGCLDPLALNYNPNATFDNGKVCVYEECPEEITIRPTDGVVFYTTTFTPSNEEGSTIAQVAPQNTTKAQQPTPISVPLTEVCCTEDVVGEPVTWNGEFCVVNRDTFCPEPLVISVDGVILGSNGLPVGEPCCNEIDTASWDPNFDNGGKTPGACIDNSQTSNELCDLSFTDLILNDDGTVTTTTIVSGGGLGGGNTTGGDDTGGDNVDGDTGVVVSDTEGCLNVFEWTISFGIEGLGWNLSLNVNDIGNPQLQIGDQIELSGFQNSPGTSCWNAGPNNINGLTVTIEQILYFQNTNTYTIITDLDISGDCPIVNGEPLCGGNCGTNDLVIEEDSAIICPNYGDGKTLQKSLECVGVTAFEFEPLFGIANALGLGANYQTLCNQNLNGDDYFLALIVSENDIPNVTNCEQYIFEQDFVDQTTASCWGQPWSYITDTQGGGQQTVSGQLSFPQNNTLQLLTSGVIPNVGGVLVFNLSLSQVVGATIEAQFSCSTVTLSPSSQVCNETFVEDGESGGSTGGGLGSFNPSGLINDLIGDLIGGLGGTTEQTNISEACCQELGNGLWSYIDGVCYWNPPKEVVSTSVGISENDVIVTDPACDNLTVCLSFFLEVPDDNECFDETSNISANLGFYSGDIRTNLFNTSQTLTYNSLEDGYCTWVQICTEIIDYDGTPFKIKLNLDGILDCCEYDIFVDDISVSCTIQDSIEVSTKNDCPGFTLNKVIDNKKSWVYNDGEPINRVFAPSADADIPWRYTDYLEQSGVYENHSKLVLNSKELYLTFNMCDSENCDTSLNVFELIEYKKNFQNFWVKFIEQFVPATTIFVSGEKWCTRPEQICKTYEDCDYINDFTQAGLGITTGDGVNDRPKTNKNDNRKVDPNSGDNTVTSEKEGDYGDNSSDDPVIFDNFFGIFIKYDPSADEERLTFPRGLLPLLKEGTDNYRNRMKPPITRLVTS